MKNLIFIILIQFLLSNTYSNETPKKESNTDLRTNKEVLSIKASSGEIYRMSLSATNHYFLSTIMDKKEKMVKVSYSLAQEIDKEFVRNFIDIKYMLESFSGKNCSIFYTLTMRGERSDICKNEKIKLDRVVELIALFKKHF